MPRDNDVDRGDERTVRVRLAGANDGPLVVYMHGSPSSRLDIDYLDFVIFELWDAVLDSLGM